MCIYQTLYFLHGVDNEHVHKVFPCAIQPVVEWLSTLTYYVNNNNLMERILINKSKNLFFNKEG
jgi:hypothetical protein